MGPLPLATQTPGGIGLCEGHVIQAKPLRVPSHSLDRPIMQGVMSLCVTDPTVARSKVRAQRRWAQASHRIAGGDGYADPFRSRRACTAMLPHLEL